jgi:hypothetical protein
MHRSGERDAPLASDRSTWVKTQISNTGEAPRTAKLCPEPSTGVVVANPGTEAHKIADAAMADRIKCLLFILRLPFFAESLCRALRPHLQPSGSIDWQLTKQPRFFPMLWLRIKKQADAVEHPRVFNHVGLLVNGPPGTAEMPFI